MNLLIIERHKQINDIAQHLIIKDINRLHQRITSQRFDEDLETATRIAIMNQCILSRSRSPKSGCSK